MEQFIKINGNNIKAELHVMLLKEDDFIIAYCPALNISAYGESESDAAQSFEHTISVFFHDLLSNKKMLAELEEMGWDIEDHTYSRQITTDDYAKGIPYYLIGQQTRSYQTTVH